MSRGPDRRGAPVGRTGREQHLRRGASALAVCTLIGYVGAVAASLAAPAAGPGGLLEAISALVFIVFAVVGWIIVRRHARHAVGWLFMSAAALMILTVASSAYARLAYARGANLPLADEAAWISLWVWVPPTVALSLIFLLFPTGLPPTPRWRWVLWAAAIQQALFLAAVVETWPRRGPSFVMSSGDIGEISGSPALGALANGGMAFLMITCAVSLIYRFRRSRGVERLQLKWVAYAAALMGALMVVTIVGAFGEEPMENTLYVIALALAVTALPVAAGISITRYRLYEIDVILNRTLVYVVLTSLLAAVYFGSVVVLQSLVAPIAANSDLAVAAATLTVAAVFRPLRDRVQAFIDQRFYRRKYDAAETVAKFSARLRHQVDLDALSSELVGVVSKTMQPAHASLWLRGAHGAPNAGGGA